MSLVRCDQISIEFGNNPLLVEADFSIEPGERVCLIGRNGAGKSTLMKIIEGSVTPDRGEVEYKDLLRVSKLDQQLPDDLDIRVFDMVKQGLSKQVNLIKRYETIAAGDLDDRALSEMEDLQAAIDTAGGWQVDQQVERIISQLGLPPELMLSELSGGWRRRVALGRALVSNPELLLLDEPTNHLDISTIEWLEHRILGFNGAVIFITHDRNLSRRLATRIVEIDRGQLLSWPGNYDQYLVLKEAANKDEDQANALFDKRLAQEENWIRQGVKARRTRNEGRVRALKSMREEHARRQKRQAKASISIETAEASGRKVIDARSITHGFNGRTLINNFKMRVMRGDRIGLIGNNGVGKSTLLKILLGQLSPDEGSVKLGTNLEMGYFDQVRRELEWDKTVAENVGNGKEYVTLDGKERHIVGYLRNFLFSPKRALTKVKHLSGGECNRVLLAKLFSQPNNLLILDEPTNDLDVEMLEVLEEQLVNYKGTLIIVSHDRDFLDNVVTSCLVFEEGGKIVEYAGSYSDWAARGHELTQNDHPDAASIAVGVINDSDNTTELAVSPSPKTISKPAKKTLSYMLQRELEQLPQTIEVFEKEIALLEQQIAAPEFYELPYEKTQPIMDEMQLKQEALDKATERWFELEEMRG